VGSAVSTLTLVGSAVVLDEGWGNLLRLVQILTPAPSKMSEGSVGSKLCKDAPAVGRKESGEAVSPMQVFSS
jgi:hypothetical protein